MHLADEPERERQFLQPLQPVHHRVDVVRNLTDVVDRLAGLGLGLEPEKVREGRLRALDLGREHRLLAHVHVEEQLLARQKHRDAVKPAEGALGDDQSIDEAEDVERRLRRQRRWHERMDDLAGDGRRDEAAKAGSRVVRRHPPYVTADPNKARSLWL